MRRRKSKKIQINALPSIMLLLLFALITAVLPRTGIFAAAVLFNAFLTAILIINQRISRVQNHGND